MGLYNSVHWMPNEDPTFFIPSYVNLTYQQRIELREAGFEPGEPFILSNEGEITKPDSKKFQLKAVNSILSIQAGSVMFFESSPGTFYVEFKYSSIQAVIIELQFFAKDASNSHELRLERSALKWGPHHLSANNGHLFDCWSSKDLGLFVEHTQLPSLIQSGSNYRGFYDLVIIASPCGSTNNGRDTGTGTTSASAYTHDSSPAAAGAGAGRRVNTTGYESVPIDVVSTSGGAGMILEADSESNDNNNNNNNNNNSIDSHHLEAVTALRNVAREAFYYRIQKVKRTQNNSTAVAVTGNRISYKNGRRVSSTEVENEKESELSDNGFDSTTGIDQQQSIGLDNTTQQRQFLSAVDPSQMQQTQPQQQPPQQRGTRRGVAAELVMHLFCTAPTRAINGTISAGGVFNHITLYGMEGFRREPSVPTASINSTNNLSRDGDGDGIIDADESHNASITSRNNTNNNNVDNIRNDVAVPNNSECIICLTDKMNTIMFPCRHLCLCASCAATLAVTPSTVNVDEDGQNQHKKCPVCRKPVIVMLQLKS